MTRPTSAARPPIDLGELRVPVKHHPMLYATGRHGCWSACSCGWISLIYTTVTGAHLAFGVHLTREAHRAH